MIKNLCFCFSLLTISFSQPAFSEQEGFYVDGTSGNELMLDRNWKQRCLKGSGGIDWYLSQRPLIGLNLYITQLQFINGSQTPDCSNGLASEIRTDALVTPMGEPVDIVWVNENFEPAAAPEGLEDISEGNLVRGSLTSAAVKVFSQERADQLNAVAFCGYSDWTPGGMKSGTDIDLCFGFGFEFDAVVIVDDSRPLWRVYNANLDPRSDGPHLISNTEYHEGPF